MLQDYPPYSGYSTAGGGGGGGAPVNAQYLVLALDGTLTDERVFTLAPRLAGTDGGAGGNYTVDLAVIVGVAGTYAYPSSVTVDTYGRVTAITAGAAPVASGWTDGGTVVYLTTPSDDVSIGSNTPVLNRKLSVYNGGTDLGISVVTLASTDNVLETGVTGEANQRWTVDGAGATRWGAGGASALDTRMYRLSAGTLALDNNAGGAGSLLPATDSLGNIGGGANRWNGVIANGFLVYATAGAANASTTIGNQAIRMGAGGGSALDLKLSRTAAATLTIDNNVGGGASIVPAADSTGNFGTNNLRWLDNVANTHRVFPSAGAVNASASLASGALKLGVGGATALDTQIVRNAAKTLQVDDNAGGAATLSVIGTTRTQTRAVQTTTQVGAYAVAATDDVVFVNPNAGAFDVTLPNANVLTGRRIQVKRITTSANIVTVKSAGGTIDNVAAATGIVLGGGTLNAITVVSDGTNWWIV